MDARVLRHGSGRQATFVNPALRGRKARGIGPQPLVDRLIGAVATLLLIVLRFVQGLAIGGQWAGAVLLATESAPPHRRGFYGAFAQVGVPAGVILANLIFLIINSAVSPEAFMAWGWRVPFILSIGLIILAIYMQLKIEDTAKFRQLQAAAAQRRAAQGTAAASPSRSPVLEVLRTHPREIVLAAGALMAI